MRRTLTPANSPVSSPSKHGDRFIPSRAGANWSVNFHRINVSTEQGALWSVTLRRA
jgi:cell division cycle 20-like protein 1 (cofactor of APC complex)